MKAIFAAYLTGCQLFGPEKSVDVDFEAEKSKKSILSIVFLLKLT